MSEENFSQILKRATSKISEDYFKTKISASNHIKNVYRERIYCYELYHQLRSAWPKSYSLNIYGEYDKSGSKIFSQSGLIESKPDFLVHTPGSFENNMIAIEVKPVTAKTSRIRNDLEKLKYLQIEAGYKFALFLLYGEKSSERIQKIKELITPCLDTTIRFWSHDNPLEEAKDWSKNSELSQ